MNNEILTIVFEGGVLKGDGALLQLQILLHVPLQLPESRLVPQISEQGTSESQSPGIGMGALARAGSISLPVRAFVGALADG